MKLTEKEREARKRYFREWREKNREKCEAAQKRFWQKMAERMEAQNGRQ